MKKKRLTLSKAVDELFKLSSLQKEDKNCKSFVSVFSSKTRAFSSSLVSVKSCVLEVDVLFWKYASID